MNNKKVLIIGGGIAGLCSGIYLRKNGFETEIVEMHTITGGLATAWKRDGYTFENCIHWLVGSKEGGELNAMWKEVFDIGQLRFFDDDIYQVIERSSQKLVVYRDIDRLEAEFLVKAPEDSLAIREFAELVRKLSCFKMPGGDSVMSRLVSYLRALPYLRLIRNYSKHTMATYAARFKDPLLKNFFSSGLSELSFLAIVFSLAWMTNRNAGYPIGGSLKMIGLLEDHYRRLGGKIRFESKVARIIVKNGKAAGVFLEGGEEIAGDIVVSAADGHATIFELLEGKFLSEKAKKIYETYKPFPSYVQISLGVNTDLRDEPGFLSRCLDRKIQIDPDTQVDSLSFRIFNFDPTFAPPGRTAVVCFIPTYNHQYWISLRNNDKAEYDAEKNRLAQDVIKIFEERFQVGQGSIDVVDVATPATVVRYTGNWKGSMEGWLMTPATSFRQMPATLPGLKDFYMVGQWISPGGGLPSGLLTARTAAQMICRDNLMKWKAA